MIEENSAAGRPDRPNRYGAITDVPGVLVGQVERIGDGWLTGVTAIVPPPGTVGAVDVRGGGPGTRETDALAPGTLADTVDAITLAGGSSYGLAAATGVHLWCEEVGRGFPVSPGTLSPIVPAAIVYDLGKGGDPTKRPDAAMGYAAAQAARGSDAGPVRTGCVGAGAGTSLSMPALKAGVGTASVRLPGGIIVGALAVVNAYGSPCVPGSAALLAAPLVQDVRLRPRTPEPDEDATRHGIPQTSPRTNTTLAVIATNARLAHPQVRRLASLGHDGMARALRPVHTLVDGDSVFALATGAIEPAVAALGDWGGAEEVGGIAEIQAAGADALTLAIVDGILAAQGVPSAATPMPGYLERYPTAAPPAWS